MTREELDTLWGKALHESVVAGEDFIRYHFAELVQKAEREACAKVCDGVNQKAYDEPDDWAPWEAADACAAAIRARGEA